MTRQEIADTMKYCLEHGSMGGHDCWLHVDENGHISDDNARDHCPNKDCKTGCVVTTLREAATLLDDPPVEPTNKHISRQMYVDTWFGVCVNCKSDINSVEHPKYCGYCGRPVKWE